MTLSVHLNAVPDHVADGLTGHTNEYPDMASQVNP